MPEKNAQSIQTVQSRTNEAELRILPFLVAGLICFSIAVLLGSGSWYFFGSNKRRISQTTETIAPIQNETPAKSEFKPEMPELKGLVEVPSGEIMLSGDKQSVKRVTVNNFSIAETEVTNAQYAEFIKETNYSPPPDWERGNFPKGKENFPVTGISFQDAEAFCQWLQKKIGFPVRLPTEAEWELAARGTQNNKYPWGNEWDGKNAVSKETGGKISAVKSFPGNRSPFGAYDMAGNVWEWTQEKVGKNDAVTDEAVKEALEKGQILRIVKGGSALSNAKEISAQARYEIPENTKVPIVGFRYIVEHKPSN